MLRGRGQWNFLSERRVIFRDHTRAIIHERAGIIMRSSGVGWICKIMLVLGTDWASIGRMHVHNMCWAMLTKLNRTIMMFIMSNGFLIPLWGASLTIS